MPCCCCCCKATRIQVHIVYDPIESWGYDENGRRAYFHNGWEDSTNIKLQKGNNLATYQTLYVRDSQNVSLSYPSAMICKQDDYIAFRSWEVENYNNGGNIYDTYEHADCGNYDALVDIYKRSDGKYYVYVYRQHENSTEESIYNFGQSVINAINSHFDKNYIFGGVQYA